MPKRATDPQVALNALLRLGGEARTPQVAEEAEVSDSIARRALETLMEQGKVTKEGWRWIVNNDAMPEQFRNEDGDFRRGALDVGEDEATEFDHTYSPGLNVAAVRSALNTAQLLIDAGKEDYFISRLAGTLLAIDDLLEHAQHNEAPTLDYARKYILRGFDNG
jgi:hypothetical protein